LVSQALIRFTAICFAIVVLGGFDGSGVTYAASAVPVLPSDVPTVGSLAREVKSPIAQKMREIRRAFRIEETKPGQVTLFANNDVAKGRIELSRDLSGDGKHRTERVQFFRADKSSVLDERVSTDGENLQFSDPSRKIFFETDDLDYSLGFGETRKEVLLNVDSREFFRIISTAHGSAAGNREIQSDFYFSGVRIFSAREFTSAEKNYHSLEYHVHSDQFGFKFFKRNRTMWTETPEFTVKVEAMRAPGLLLDEHRYFANRAEVYGLDNFLGLFQSKIYSPYFTKGVGSTATVVTEHLPVVQARKNLALKSRFLDELILLNTRVEQAKSNPSVLTQISTTITQFIAAMQLGQLEVKDNRPALE